jgi:hypothetical protein
MAIKKIGILCPMSFVVGTDQLVNDNNKTMRPDPKNLDVKVKVGWVKGFKQALLVPTTLAKAMTLVQTLVSTNLNSRMENIRK